MPLSAINKAILDDDVRKLLNNLYDTLLAGGGSVAQADLDATEAAIITDLGNVRTGVIAALTAIATLAGALNTLATKLNADAGVTDANYVTNNAVDQVATSSPAAITTA